MAKTISVTLADLQVAIEKVRHRGIQKRIDSTQPKVPKIVTSTGTDWRPCEVCQEEAVLIYDILSR